MFPNKPIFPRLFHPLQLQKSHVFIELAELAVLAFEHLTWTPQYIRASERF